MTASLSIFVFRFFLFMIMANATTIKCFFPLHATGLKSTSTCVHSAEKKGPTLTALLSCFLSSFSCFLSGFLSILFLCKLQEGPWSWCLLQAKSRRTPPTSSSVEAPPPSLQHGPSEPETPVPESVSLYIPSYT